MIPTLQHTASALLFAAVMVSAQSATSSSAAPSASSSSTSSGILAQSSPSWLPSFPAPSGVNSGYPTGAIDTGATLDKTQLNSTAYPDPWSPATTDHSEITAVMNSLDWTKVPDAPPNKAASDGSVTFGNYDESKDPYCW